jgi:hypothetical protein
MLAESVLAHLKGVAEVVLWNQDVFKLGRGNLETLLGAVRDYDFAVFVLGPDDEIEHRGIVGTTPRANVLFELGLFMGALGSNRVFAMFSDQKDLLIPNDFAGVTVAKYKSEGLKLADFPSCKAATKNACDEIRIAIREYKPVAPVRSEILSSKTVRSIKSYLAFKQEDIKMAVDVDDRVALEQFDRDCHAVLKGSHIYDSIKDALGAPFGVYVQATGAVGDKPTDERYLNCCLRPNAKPGGKTYLDALLLNDAIDQPKIDFIGDNIVDVVRKKSFGHWLLSTTLDPVPLAIVLDCSRKVQWDAEIILAHDTPLVFAIEASATSDDFAPVLTKLKYVAFAGLDDRLKSLKRMLSDREDDYMGTTIKSVLFVPIHGWPGITLQILTRESIKIDTETPQLTSSPAGPAGSSVQLTIDELMSIRLCGERLQGLLAHKVRPVLPSAT